MAKSGTIIAVVSDTHVGSSTALSPPKFTLHTKHPQETHVVEYNFHQRWLYACWEDYWGYIRSRVGIRGKHRKNRLIVFFLGDAVDANHHGSSQLIPEPDDQIAAGVDLYKVPIHMSDKSYLTYGTDIHNGGNGQYEIALADEFGSKIRHGHYFSLNVDGVTFDIGHHGRAGRRDWTSSAANYAVDIALEYVKDDMKPPRYVLRGHTHTLDDSGFKVPYTRAITCPSWQLRTSYGHKVKSGRSHNDIGGVVFDTTMPDYVDFSKARYSLPQEQRSYETV